jgi:hypothetical protein
MQNARAGWESGTTQPVICVGQCCPWAVTLSVAAAQPVKQGLHVKLSPSSPRQRGVAHFNLIGFENVLLLIALPALYLSSCASTGMSYRDRSNDIEQLQEARRTDLSDAMDPGLDPAAQGYYMTQAAKAETVIDDLTDRKYVSEAEISEALFVPPKYLSPEQRVVLIRQLEHAKMLDDQIYRDHLGGWDPILTEDCNIQGIRVDRVVKRLEAERAVSWSEIEQAIWVPNESAW